MSMMAQSAFFSTIAREKRLRHLCAARRVEHADDREAEHALPDLDDRRRELADGRALDLDGRELLLELLLVGCAPLLRLIERVDHLVDALEERRERMVLGRWLVSRVE